MASDYESRIDLSDEAPDNFPRDFGGLYDPSMESPQQVLGGAYGGNLDFIEAQRHQYEATLFGRRAGESRASLAAALLQSVARETSADRWSDVAEKALAAAAIIYPDPKEAE